MYKMIPIKTMDELLDYIDTQKCHFKSIYIHIQLPDCKEPEVIINGYKNIKNKREYYKETYNNNLTHKFNKEIKIVGISYDLDIDLFYNRKPKKYTDEEYKKIANDIYKALKEKGLLK